MSEFLNRRDALTILLLAPTATVGAMTREAQDEKGSRISVFSNKTSLTINLCDQGNTDEAGVTGLIVNYKGKSITFTAKGIWEALRP
jgi:hypothetical protein